MIFTDWKFFVFFFLVFCVYWTLRSNLTRKLWLLASSVVFYAAWDWRFLGLVFLVIVNAYLAPLLITSATNPAQKRLILTTGIVLSLGVLAFFKYFDFFVESFSHLLSLNIHVANIILPIGISFYTFHSLSYMIDTYRGRIVPTKSFVDVSLYILFFPQLVAGPIVRAPDLLPQMREARAFPAGNIKYFLLLFLIGYFKKALISDNLSPLVDSFYGAPQSYGAADTMLATLFYTVQIYCDFSGYTDMAIAVAGMLGYRLRQNFNHPYLASSLVDFWRRWHMSLSFWLRDYLYIPLGGNRGGFLFQSRNVLITMLLGGLWHGASWTFVLWGGLHGLGLITYNLWQRLRSPSPTATGLHYSLLGNVLTFIFVAFAWTIFRAPSFDNFIAVLGRLTVTGPLTLISSLGAALILTSLLILHVSSYHLDLRAITPKINSAVFAALYGLAVALMLPFVNVAVQPFIYFQF